MTRTPREHGAAVTGDAKRSRRPGKREVERLMRDWLKGPRHQLLEETPGFEAHREALLAFRLEREGLARAREEDRIGAVAAKLGCTVALACHVEGLERRIAELSEALERLDRDTDGRIARLDARIGV